MSRFCNATASDRRQGAPAFAPFTTHTHFGSLREEGGGGDDEEPDGDSDSEEETILVLLTSSLPLRGDLYFPEVNHAFRVTLWSRICAHGVPGGVCVGVGVGYG